MPKEGCNGFVYGNDYFSADFKKAIDNKFTQPKEPLAIICKFRLCEEPNQTF